MSWFMAVVSSLKTLNQRFISILADEASVCSNQEQLYFVLKLVAKVGDIREEFLGFLHCALGLRTFYCKCILFRIHKLQWMEGL